MSVFNLTSTDGLRLSGKVHSPVSPRAVMTLIHGFGEHQDRYSDMAADLNRSGIAVVTMDLRGHGISEGKRGVCNDYALLLGDVGAQLTKARQLFPSLPQTLYGHSMGGGIVLRYVSDPARAQGLAGVIASAPLISLPKPLPKIQTAAAKIIRKIAPGLTLPHPISGDQISTLEAEQKRYEADALNHGKLGIGLAVDMIENGDIVLGRAAQMTLRTLVMHAVDDQLTAAGGSKHYAELSPVCALHVLEGCQHEMHNDVTRPQIYGLMSAFILGPIDAKMATA